MASAEKNGGAPRKTPRHQSPKDTPPKYKQATNKTSVSRANGVARANGATPAAGKSQAFGERRQSVLGRYWRRYAQLGYSALGVHPVGVVINNRDRSKSPVMFAWQHFCNRQPEPREIAVTLDLQPRSQIGAACGFGGLIVLDADTENEALKKVILDFMGAIFPDAPLRKGNRSRIGAYMLQWDGWTQGATVPSMKFVDGDGKTIFELLGSGRQVIMPPSAHPSGVAYEMADGEELPPPVDELPKLKPQFVDMLVANIERAGFAIKQVASARSEELPTPEELTVYVKRIPAKKAVQHTIDFLKSTAKISIEGQRGHDGACLVWQRCADLGCPPDNITPLMWAHWNRRCLPPWSSYDALAAETQGLLASRRSPIGVSNPERIGAMYFEEPEDAAPTKAAAENNAAENKAAENNAAAGSDDKTPMFPDGLTGGRNDDTAVEMVVIKPTPYSWRDPTTIPSRDFLFGKHYIRGFVSTTIAPGGIGKSALIVAEALSMVSGLGLLHGIKPLRPLNVWWFNGEDPPDELDRRVAATVQRYEVTRDACPGKLFVDSGRKMNLVVVETTPEGTSITKPVVDALMAAIVEKKIDVLTIDPFVSSHRVSENDNPAIDVVMKVWAGIAEKCNCAIELVHHARKTNGAEVGVEDARGASAQVAAARDVRTLNRMTAEEARKAGVDNHQLYFRVDDGKSNMAPPANGATWFCLRSVDLDNPTDGRPSDKVGVPEGWEWPQPGEGVTDDDLHAVQDAVAQGIGEGRPWRGHPQSKGETWVGYAVARVLGLNVGNPMDKAKIAGLLKIWIESGALIKTDTVVNDKGKTVPTIKVGKRIRTIFN